MNNKEINVNEKNVDMEIDWERDAFYLYLRTKQKEMDINFYIDDYDDEQSEILVNDLKRMILSPLVNPENMISQKNEVTEDEMYDFCLNGIQGALLNFTKNEDDEAPKDLVQHGVRLIRYIKSKDIEGLEVKGDLEGECEFELLDNDDIFRIETVSLGWITEDQVIKK